MRSAGASTLIKHFWRNPTMLSTDRPDPSGQSLTESAEMDVRISQVYACKACGIIPDRTRGCNFSKYWLKGWNTYVNAIYCFLFHIHIFNKGNVKLCFHFVILRYWAQLEWVIEFALFLFTLTSTHCVTLLTCMGDSFGNIRKKCVSSKDNSPNIAICIHDERQWSLNWHQHAML